MPGRVVDCFCGLKSPQSMDLEKKCRTLFEKRSSCGLRKAVLRLKESAIGGPRKKVPDIIREAEQLRTAEGCFEA